MGGLVKICRVCGRKWEFADGQEWLQAIPDGLSGQALRDNVQWWCSRKCRDYDPQYEPLPDGEALLQMINRLKAGAGPIPEDIDDFFARGSGCDRDEIVRIADRILGELQGRDAGPRQLEMDLRDGPGEAA